MINLQIIFLIIWLIILVDKMSENSERKICWDFFNPKMTSPNLSNKLKIKHKYLMDRKQVSDRFLKMNSQIQQPLKFENFSVLNL